MNMIEVGRFKDVLSRADIRQMYQSFNQRNSLQLPKKSSADMENTRTPESITDLSEMPWL